MNVETSLAPFDSAPLPSGTVLVVGHDDPSRDRWSGWLREAGLNVVTCPGPTLGPAVPTACPSCALIEVADVVLLDLRGPEGGALLFTCPVRSRRLAVLSEPEDPVGLLPGDHVAVLSRAVERGELLDAAWQLLVDTDFPEEG